MVTTEPAPWAGNTAPLGRKHIRQFHTTRWGPGSTVAATPITQVGPVWYLITNWAFLLETEGPLLQIRKALMFGGTIRSEFTICSKRAYSMDYADITRSKVTTLGLG